VVISTLCANSTDDLPSASVTEGVMGLRTTKINNYFC
jgi:hypothetical protein